MVAGYPSLATVPSSEFLQWRAAALRMALRVTRIGSLIQPPEWSHLDPSEKSAISSLLGIVVTKLLVEKFLNAPIFLFLEVHFSLIYPRDPAGKEIKTRPDFAAMSPAGEWFSVEAKGRSRLTQATLDKGKTQAEALGSVNGLPVSAGVVCVTSFKDRRLKACFVDPKSPEPTLLEAKIDKANVLNAYYNGLFRYREFSKNLGYRDVTGLKERVNLWQSPELDVQFGLLPEMEDALKMESNNYALKLLNKIGGSSDTSPNPYLGSDGIIVIPGKSWLKGDPNQPKQ